MDKIKNIDYHITDRCNLNCVSCGHFCPLVPKTVKPKSIDQIYNDLNRLKGIVGGRLKNLNFTGGECTTHPQFREALTIAIMLFAPNVTIYTNGSLYRKLIANKDLIQCSGIKILQSDYSQSWYEESVRELSNTFGDQYQYISRRGEDGIVYFIHQFLSKDEVASDEEILTCEAREECLQLVGSRLYVCQYAAYFNYFDNYFNGQHNLKLGDKDGYIDLEDKPTVDDILEFMRTTNFDLCKHCIDCKRNYDIIPWRRSSKELSEWYDG